MQQARRRSSCSTATRSTGCSTIAPPTSIPPRSGGWCSHRQARPRGSCDARDQAGTPVAVVRLEQLYPWPEQEIRAVLARYPKESQLWWVQAGSRRTWGSGPLPTVPCAARSATPDVGITSRATPAPALPPGAEGPRGERESSGVSTSAVAGRAALELGSGGTTGRGTGRGVVVFSEPRTASATRSAYRLSRHPRNDEVSVEDRSGQQVKGRSRRRCAGGGSPWRRPGPPPDGEAPTGGDEGRCSPASSSGATRRRFRGRIVRRPS